MVGLTQRHYTSSIVPRSEHPISRARISENTLKVLYRLKHRGFEAYLVGGGVRDLLLDHTPKDFDVVTTAHPEEVAQLFRNCRIIGHRFRLAHIHFGQEIIEVATFRSEHKTNGHHSQSGRILRDNVYGTSLKEDVQRRDFTVNGIYYNIQDFSLIDPTGGLDDLRNGLIRAIGPPERRFQEDPVRMLRAVRFASKLNFRLHPETEAPFPDLSWLLEDIPPNRLFEESLQLFLKGHALDNLELLLRYRLLAPLLPPIESCTSLGRGGADSSIPLIRKTLQNTDERIAKQQPVTPTFLFAALLWQPVQHLWEEKKRQGAKEVEALRSAGATVLDQQIKRVALSRRITTAINEIWVMQAHLARHRGRKALRLLGHPRFRAAFDLLLLRVTVREADPRLSDWWTKLQGADPERQKAMAQATAPASPGRPRRRPRTSTHRGQGL